MEQTAEKRFKQNSEYTKETSLQFLPRTEMQQSLFSEVIAEIRTFLISHTQHLRWSISASAVADLQKTTAA